MSRSLKKGPFIDAKLLAKIQKVSASGGSASGGKLKVEIKTWSRDSTIFPEMVGMTFLVHNGKIFISVLCSENMVGHKLGEFSPTRKFTRHGGKMAKDEAMAAAEAEKRAQEASKAPAEGVKK
ncbi:MAG: 30S ribosomal protein S19 [Candidatus Doudnabacteria bacterium RIFCSPLOWO2_02_FULL_49_13]|uniref:Small ribosomal subunit protein uS19 n=1 Tax=Candidatus Doudnabacteria bacterium RIFCSPHIGHO2_12_FULL_48_16 TaxID=1817838 RepID=A0A1F5PJH8_9BACT|nr:ribosomal protein S19 [uncultured bacterium]OGE87776.1 MAG: 30S ribosomal protein S19 [Candidatus Doudnabacteria bacterium RIFCSPHIGHO2_02_FULL_49_24]OGE88138.1 MAG: 30S ribosomal protein S19 [Candidatus Doudnabacteria bacterium RIFCSPHIGHO2_01_FULL_50_67]OGE90009.1 MAG: 30S ribosomal protein S19 [Candidatus Doudnabacteria bacterium RIFCSPHIGHO2_12_FULL_48_16]OGE96582.1 MAG: 30S ribosomal protein S19 [Candidatus Doudnabacteria bacterium RIFCSPLOWO2_01_FULL_49_40]OGF03152.1 MAG: 30S ribosoma